MRGLGTIINVALILFGGLCGLLFGKRLRAQLQETLLNAAGVAVLFLGVSGALARMLSLSGGELSVRGGMMMIVTLALGAVTGELLHIDAGIGRFGEWLKHKSNSGSDNSFVSGFVTASCTVCIGAMAVVGSVQDGIHGDFSILASKGVLDAIIICIMAAAQGKGCVFSAIPVAVFQGAVTLAAVFFGSFLTQAALDNLSLVGSVLIFCVGVNIIWDRGIRVANLLPALVFASAWAYIGPLAALTA